MYILIKCFRNQPRSCTRLRLPSTFHCSLSYFFLIFVALHICSRWPLCLVESVCNICPQIPHMLSSFLSCRMILYRESMCLCRCAGVCVCAFCTNCLYLFYYIALKVAAIPGRAGETKTYFHEAIFERRQNAMVTSEYNNVRPIVG